MQCIRVANMSFYHFFTIETGLGLHILTKKSLLLSPLLMGGACKHVYHNVVFAQSGDVKTSKAVNPIPAIGHLCTVKQSQRHENCLLVAWSLSRQRAKQIYLAGDTPTFWRRNKEGVRPALGNQF